MAHMTDKTAVVTGAGKGIGRAVTLMLLREGVNVTGLSRTESDLKNLTSEAGELSGRILAYPGDVADEEIVKVCIKKTVSEYGGIDYLVNNAGIGIFKPVHEFTVDEWDSVINTNLRGTFLATKYALPHMIKKNSGTIVNISSIAGKQAFEGGAAYCASKFAMNGFARSLMFDVRKHNIRVILICPGSVATRFHTRGDHLKDKDSILSPDDCARTVLHALTLPQRASVHEIELRITNP